MNEELKYKVIPEGSASAQMDLLAAEISKLDKSVEILIEKIAPILTGDPWNEGVGNTENPTDSHIAKIIRDNKNEIMRIGEKVRCLANHVDVIV